jgi:D-alanyl-D-alanine carboxypeptidase/D-alanyl-D-alanine-endopeptidase (penicillin-binding protein 4)
MKIIFVASCLFLNLFCLNSQNKLERKLLKAIKNEPSFNGAQVGITLVDLEKKKELVTIHSKKRILPASLVKLLTLYGAIQKFGDSLPALHYKKEKNRFYFWSSGYPLVNHPLYKDSTITSFLKQQKDSIFYISRPMISSPLGLGWAWDDQAYYFSAKKSSFPIHGNVVEIKSDPMPEQLQFNPSFFENKLKYTFEKNNYIFRTNDHVYKLSRFQKDSIYVPFIPSDSLIIQTLSNIFNCLIYNETKRTDIHFNYKTLNTSVEKVYKAIIQDSDNLIAESLMLMLSGTEQWQLDTALGIDIIHRQNKMMFENIEQVDGSGLSRNNLLTHKILIKVLKNIYKSLGRTRVKDYFPQGNLEGTLLLYAPSVNMSFVYAKTGSMKNNSLLAGYLLSPSNKPYSFVVSVNNHMGKKRAIQKGIADLLLIIVNKMKLN